MKKASQQLETGLLALALTVTQVLPIGLLPATALAVGTPTPSTNVDNQEKGWAYFSVLELRPG